MFVKICGLTHPEHAVAAVEAGADAVGLVFHPPSPRHLDLATAQRIAGAVAGRAQVIAVFHHPTRAALARVQSALSPDLFQVEPMPLSGGCQVLPVFHDGPDVVPMVLAATASHTTVLLDSPVRGGRGVQSDWVRAARLAQHRRVVLAGGLDANNVGRAIATVQPFGVDVSSGVEATPGRKDPDRIYAFITSARQECIPC